MTKKKVDDKATVSLLQSTSEGYHLGPSADFNSDAPEKLLGRLKEAADIARSEKKALIVRILVSSFDLKALAGSISALGFKKLYDRVEYIHPLDASIPAEAKPSKPGAPGLSWVPGLKTYGIEELGAIYKKAAVDDPSGIIPVEATPADFGKDLENDLASPDFHVSPDAVQVGCIEGRPAAFVFAQVLKQSTNIVTLEGKRTIEGWSRLSYMGVLPEFRGRGYGREVHRHGLRTLRAMGGLTYHGGTARDNVPMRRLFESSGCAILRLLEEWKLSTM
jgi:ribosomal protein S18 acetylase RimI-like enzyme